MPASFFFGCLPTVFRPRGAVFTCGAISTCGAKKYKKRLNYLVILKKYTTFAA